MNKKKIAVSAALVAGAGYVAGILTAPKSGKDTRKDIAKSAASAKIQAERKLKQAHSELKDLISDAEVKSSKLKDKASAEMNDAIKKAKIAREKAKEMISAIHSGETDDKNLEAALAEIKLAQKNLITYLKK